MSRQWDLKIGEVIGPAECPLMRRWFVETPIGSLRLHHFLRSDADRYLHDHPWWFVTLVLAGSYTDVSEKGRDRLRRGSVRFRPAQWAHQVRSNGAWTLIVTGRKRRDWGFWVSGVHFVERLYFGRFGHVACSDIPEARS